MSQLVGLAGISLIREIVRTTGLTKFWAVLTSLVVGILLNLALAVAVGNDIKVGIAIGLVAGFASNVYNDIKSF